MAAPGTCLHAFVLTDPLAPPVCIRCGFVAAPVPIPEPASMPVERGDAMSQVAQWKPGSILRNRLKERIVAEAVKQGASAEQAQAAFEEAVGASDRPFLDWLANGGFEKLLEIVMTIIKMLA